MHLCIPEIPSMHFHLPAVIPAPLDECLHAVQA
jgi:hypothetical protein